MRRGNERDRSHDENGEDYPDNRCSQHTDLPWFVDADGRHGRAAGDIGRRQRVRTIQWTG